LRKSGSAVLRFNFRGVGLSQGKYAGGVGEIEDARASLDWVRSRHAGLPFSLAGFSFGARVILKLGCRLEHVARLIAVGLPTRGNDLGLLAECAVPKIFIQSTHDQFGTKPELERAFEKEFAHPKRLLWIEARDHFFQGALERLEEAVACL